MNLKKILLCVCCGIAAIVIGIVTLNQSSSLKEKCIVETVGTVTELVCEYDNDDEGYTYFPIIEYQVGEEKISQKSSTGQNPPKYAEGDQVEILYNPDNSYEYIIKGDKSGNIAGIIFIVLGIIFIIAGFSKDNNINNSIDNNGIY